MKRLSRKDFLALGAALVGGYAFQKYKKNDSLSAAFVQPTSNILLNIILEGGPDFRHLFVPPPSSDYGKKYWPNRAASHYISSTDSSEWLTRYNSDYSEHSPSSTPFGILSKCGWLASQFDAGNVAIVNNVRHSESRDHAHSMLVLQAADYNAKPYITDIDGWGGRLAKEAMGNVLSMTYQVRPFCKGVDNVNSKIISVRNTREFGLYTSDALSSNPASTNTQAVMSRALQAYYAAKTIDTNSVYAKFLAQEKKLHSFTNLVKQRLDENPLPAAIEALYSGSDALNSRGFGQQIRNVHDAYKLADLMDFRVGALEYGGWDSHKRQKEWIEPKLEDLFGTGKGLDTLFANMSDADKNRTVIVVSGEFGRQLKANGGNGTDHGRGNVVLLIGTPVNGGIYGEMFPDTELVNYESFNRDISGLTDFDRVFGSVCDWHSSSGAAIFPNRASSNLEAGVNPASFLS